MKRLIFMLMLVILPFVLAANVICPSTINFDEVFMGCNVTGSEKVSVSLVAVNNVSLPIDYQVLIMKPSGKFLGYSSPAKPKTVILPVKLEIRPKYLLDKTMGAITGVDYDLGWALSGRVNYLIFRIDYLNGTADTVVVPIYIEKVPKDWLPLLLYGLDSLTVAFILYGIYTLVSRLSDREIPKRKRFAVSFGVAFSINSQIFWAYFGALLFYFLGSAEHLRGDIFISGPIFILIVFGIAFYFGISPKRREWSFTGLEWITVSVAFLPVLGYSMGFLFASLFLFLTLIWFQQRRSLHSRFESAWPLGLVWWVFLLYLSRPDFSLALVFLVALIFHFLALWRYKKKVKDAPYGDEFRSSEVEELLRKFDRVIKEMKKEGYQHEKL